MVFVQIQVPKESLSQLSHMFLDKIFQRINT